MKTRIKQHTRVIPADLLKLKQQFEYWRQTRAGNDRIPADLLNEALALSPKHGITLVSRQLGLNHAALKAQRQKIEASEKSRTDLAIEERFVELAPVSQQELIQQPRLIQVRCELGGLTILLKSPQAEDWDNLMTGYLRATLHVQAQQ